MEKLSLRDRVPVPNPGVYRQLSTLYDQLTATKDKLEELTSLLKTVEAVLCHPQVEQIFDVQLLDHNRSKIQDAISSTRRKIDCLELETGIINGEEVVCYQ